MNRLAHCRIISSIRAATWSTPSSMKSESLFTKVFNRLTYNLYSAIFMALVLCPGVLSAAPNTVIDPEPVTWNIIGLDSNELIGPQDYPVGVRVVNTGDMADTNITATFTWESANQYINLLDDDTVVTTTLAPGEYIDFYFTVRVTRDDLARQTQRDYKITIDSDTIGTPISTEDTLFVEDLLSQQSNSVLSLLGPDEIEQGQTRTFILSAETASGREQVTQFVNFPNTFFQVLDVQTYYSIPGTTIDKFYADACGWNRDLFPPTLKQNCQGPAKIQGGKAGGTIYSVYTVYVKQTPTDSVSLTTLILDATGSSFKYNADFGLDVLVIKPPADLFVVKTALEDPVEAGNQVDYLISVVNASNNLAEDVVLSDTLPLGLTYVSAVPPPNGGAPNPLLWNLGNINPMTTVTVLVKAQSSCETTGMLTNTAFVSALTRDNNSANNLTTHTVLIRDSKAPVIACPANLDYNADAGLCSKANVTYAATATDNCGNQHVTFTYDPPSGSTFPVGTTTVNVTAKDRSGNVATCQFTVTVRDTTPPALTCLADIDINADALTCSAANAGVTAPIASDNCTTVTPVSVVGVRSDLVADISAPYNVGVTTIVWTATDANNNQTSCTQKVTVRDNTPPVVQCPSTVVWNADAGQCTASGVTFDITATDNCGTGNVNIVAVPPSGSTFPIGNTTVNVTATDQAGNIATCSFTVTVVDNQAPTISCNPAINVEADVVNCSATIATITPPTYSDNCANAALSFIRSDGETVLNAPFPVGTTTITWTVTDGANLMATCLQTVTVADTTSPTIMCADPIVVPADADECEAGEVVLIDPVTGDNCTTASIQFERSDSLGRLDPFPVGVTEVIWTVFDEAGNATSCTQTVTVEDTIPPTITCPATINVDAEADSCEAVGVVVTPPTLVADNCSETTVTGTRSDQQPLDAAYPVGTTTIKWTVIDASGNTASCDQLVVVTDNTAPVIACAPTVNVTSNIENCSATAVNITPPTATDNCSNAGNITLTPSRSDGLDFSAPYPVGTTTITWTAEDESGNTDTCPQLVVVTDNVPPTIDCPAGISVSADAQTCTADDVNVIAPVTDDNCGTATLTFVRSDGSLLDLDDPYPLGVTTIVWTVTDVNDNISTCAQTVTVTDDTAPAIDCPADISQANDPNLCGAVITFGATATDACGNTSVTLQYSHDPGTVFPVGTTVVTVTATDGAGNESECSFSVTVTDTQNPMITCPADVMSCMQDMINLGNPVLSDNCSSVSLLSVVRSDNLPLSANYPVGVTVVTYTAIDDAGNMATCQQNVVISADALPMVGCPDDFTTNALLGECVTGPIDYPEVNVMDNCSTDPAGLVITFDPPEGTALPVGVTTVTVTVEDSDGNTDMCQFAVTVLDITPPALTCPDDITVSSTTGQCAATNVTFELPGATDTCTSAAPTVTAVPASGSTFPVGTTPVVVTATDEAGNVATCTFNVTVVDAEPPTIACPVTVNVMADVNQCEAANINLGIPTVADNCSGVNVPTAVRDDGLALGAPYPVGTTIVTWTVTDGAGNSTSCDQLVIVSDTMMPEIICPDAITTNALVGECASAPIQYELPMIMDNCTTDPADFTVTFDPPQNTTFTLGMTTVTVTVADAIGNETSCTFTVTVNDATPPVLECPQDLTVDSTPGVCGAVVTFDIGATDQCTTDVTVVTTPASGSTFPVGTTTVDVVATDGSGNISRCSFDVTVRDAAVPVLECPQILNVSSDPGLCGAVVDFATTVTDNCGNTSVTVQYSHNSGTVFPVGSTVVTVTATDDAGNNATCSFEVVVTDNQNPMITCPPDVMSCMQDMIDLGNPVLSDNCSSVSLLSIVRSDNLPLSANYPVGVTVITYTAIDDAGNMATCQQNVVISADALPMIGCPDDFTTNALAGQCFTGPIDYPDVNVMDNCSTDPAGLVITFNPPEGTALPVGVTTVTVTVEDPDGNTDMCQFAVTVLDITPPVLTCPNDITVSSTTGQCGATNVTFDLGSATDTCSAIAPVLTSVPASGSTFPVGTTVVTVTATDAAGNISRCTFNVTVVDAEPPTIVCPPAVNVMAATDMCNASNVNLGTPTVADNCSGVNTPTAVRGDGLALNQPYPVGTTIVTWTVTDGAGNSTSCDQTVTVTDTVMPEIECPANITVSALAGQCVSGPVEYELPVVSDNCTTDPNDLVITFNPPQNSTFPLGVHTVTVTVTDQGGNKSTCTFTVTVVDDTPPVVTCPANIIRNTDPGLCTANVTFTIPATDQCPGQVSVVADPASGSVFPVGDTTVNVTATDAAGNTATCSFTVTVNDLQAPVIECPATVNVTADANCEATNVNVGVPEVTDNCQPVSNTASRDVLVEGTRDDGLALGQPYPVGTTTITWKATDDSGNMATCQQLVIVTDSSAPEITCQSDIIISAPAGECLSGPVEYQVPIVTDNCSTGPLDITVTFDPPAGTSFPIGETTVTATATDMSGNQTTCTFMVIVEDVTPPTISCPGNLTVSSEPGECGVSSVAYEVTAADSCSTPVVVTVEPPSGSPFPVGTSTVTATAVDAAGNTASCTFTVTVVDNQAPAITCPSAMVLETSPGACTANNVTFTAEATDNCGGLVTVTFNPPSGSNLGVGVHIITATAADTAGNTSSCTFTVTVQDKEKPMLLCNAEDTITVETANCEISANVPLTPPVAKDQCGAVTVSGHRGDAQPINSPFPIGDTLILWVAEDSAGNRAGCYQTVQVIERCDAPPDCGLPQIICAENIKTMTIGCELEVAVDIGYPIGFDNCGPLDVVGVRDDGRPLTDPYPIGDTVINWTVTNAQGSVGCITLVWVDPGICELPCLGPDLIVMDKMMPMFQCKGKKAVKCTVNAWFVVTNIGTEASGPTEVCFYLSNDETLDSGDYLIKNKKKLSKLKGLQPGEMVGVDLWGKLPKGVNPAGKYIIAVVDCPNKVAECREDNNNDSAYID